MERNEIIKQAIYDISTPEQIKASERFMKKVMRGTEMSKAKDEYYELLKLDHNCYHYDYVLELEDRIEILKDSNMARDLVIKFNAEQKAELIESACDMCGASECYYGGCRVYKLKEVTK